MTSEKAKFILFGAYNTAFGYGLFALGLLSLEGTLHYTTISIVCHFISVTHSFFIQRKYVFSSSGSWIQELLRFHLAYLLILPISLMILWLLHEFMKIPLLLAQAVTLTLVVTLSYLSSSRFTFRNSLKVSDSAKDATSP